MSIKNNTTPLIDDKTPGENNDLQSNLLNFKYNTLLQQLPIGIAIVEPTTGEYVFINSNFSQILGYSEEELKGKTFQSITHPDDLEKNVSDLIKLREGKIDTYRIKKRNIRKDGTVVWVDLTVTRLLDKINNREYHLGAITDITKSKLAEQELKASEELLRTVITNAPISIFATDKNGLFTLHEGKAVERVGMKPGENVGVSAYDLFSELEVKDHNGNVITGKSILDRIAEGEYLSGITELNGVIFDNHFAPIIDEDDHVAGMLGVATDITEQKKIEKERLALEKRYQILFNQIDEGFCIVEMLFDNMKNPVDYRFLEVNPAFEKHIGLKNVKGKRIREFIPDIEKNWPDIYGKVALTGTPARFIRKSKSFNRWFDVYAFRIGAPEKHQVAILFNNITKRKLSQDELQKREEKWHKLFEILPVGVSIVNADNKILEVNSALAQILDLTKEELLDDKYKNRSYFRSDMSLMPAEEFPSIRALREKKVIKDVEIGIKKEDGSLIWTNVSAAHLSSLNATVTITADITERKQSESALLERQKELKEAQRLAKIGSWEWDIITDTISWSEEYYRIYDIDPNTSPPCYEQHLKAYTPKSQKHLDEAVKKCMKTGEPYEIDLELASSKLKSKWIRARGECQFNDKGKIIGLHGTAQDITDRKKQEDELRYRAEITNNITDGICLIDVKNLTILHTNRRMEKMFGYRHGEMIGKHVSTLNKADNKGDEIKIVQDIIQTISKKGKWKGVLLNKKKDGAAIWTQSSISKFNHPGFGQVYITVKMDITEQIQAETALRENEKRLASMIANISDVIAIIDEKGVNRYKSPNVEKWFGWKPDELVGKNTFEYIHPDDIILIQKAFKDLIEKPDVTQTLECRYLCKNEDYKWIELTAVNRFNDTTINGILINYHDISTRKKAENNLVRNKNELKKLTAELITIQETEKKMLAQELHDEIGQALTAMKINLSSIKSNLPTNHDVRAIKRIAETNEILDNIISQIHNISLNLRPELLDVLGLAATLKSYGNQFAKRTGIRVHFKNNTQKTLDNRKEINLYRIVQEAFNNTAKYAEAKNIILSLQDDENNFHLTIEDDGKGFNLNATPSSPGMGLIGMKERVSSMNGEMEIKSEPGKGTRIKIEVPLINE